jgi:drug/metabolite transporter (DMT)-like permease
LAAAVFLWYDSVTRIGASKEGLLAGPLETVVVLTLAWFLLKEKLRKMQLIGVNIALSGFLETFLSSSLQLSLQLSTALTFGDFEAILSGTAGCCTAICGRAQQDRSFANLHHSIF